jgi:DNA-binding NtrC family response regulator
MSDDHSMQQRIGSRRDKVYVLHGAKELPKSKKILVLEDDVAFAANLKEALGMQGYIVTVVANGAEGLKEILVTDFSVIVCDMVMPNFPGDMFYRAVERVRPELCRRFIFMTGHQGNRKIEEFIRSVRGLMLWKPFQMHVLFDTIKGIIKKSSSENGLNFRFTPAAKTGLTEFIHR